MTDLVTSLKEGVSMLKRKDDDMFDRLSNRYTIGFIVAASLFLATKSYVGDPIDCFTPKEFHDNWVEYTDDYCWIKNTYYVAPDENLIGPGDIKNPDHNAGEELSYYQWVPIILAFMLLVFAIPVYFWQFAMWSSGYDVEAIVKVACDADNLDPVKRDETTKYLVAQLDRHISYHRQLGGGVKIPLGNKYGRYLYFMYIITKVLYTACPVVLLYLLKIMMGEGYGDYGYTAMRGLVMNDGTYRENPMFPRVTICDFAIRKLGQNIHRYTVQCVLTVNLFNEKAFLVLWWWLAVLAVLSAFGLLVFLIKTLRPNAGSSYVMKYLVVMKVIDAHDDREVSDVNRFVSQYLSLDGVFCMRLLANNTTDVIAGEIITELYKKWKENHAKDLASMSSDS